MADELQAALMERAKREQARRQAAAEPNIFKKALDRVQDFSEGIGVSALETYYGAKDLMGIGTPEDRKTLEKWRAMAGESGFGTAGQITGDVAQYMLPGMAITKATKIAPLVADMTGTLAIDAAKLPEYGESRTDRMTTGAAYGLGGHVLGKTLGTITQGVTGTPAAERLRDAGARLTPGQTREGLLRRFEAIGEAGVPGLSKGVREAEKISAESVNKVLLDKAAPPTPGSVRSGSPVKAKVNSIEELNAAYDDAYDAAWGKVDELDLDPINDSIETAYKNVVVGKDQAALSRIIEGIEDIINKPGASAKEIDQWLRKHQRPWKGGKNAVWNDAIDDLRSGLLRSAPDDVADAVKAVNKDYGKKMAINYAATSKKAMQGKGLDPDSLTSGVRRSGDLRSVAEGKGPLQQELQDWAEVIGEPSGVIPLLKRRVIQAVPEGGLLQYPADLVAGNYNFQRHIRRMMGTDTGQALTRTLSPYRPAAAIGQQMDEEER